MRSIAIGFCVVIGLLLATGCENRSDTNSDGTRQHTTDVNVPGVKVHVETPAGKDKNDTHIETEKKIERDGDEVKTKEKKTITNPDGSQTKTETKTERKND